MPQEDDSRLDRYYKATRALGKDGKVEALMKGVLDDLLLLSLQCGIDTGDQIEKMKDAVEEISALEPSVPDRVFAGATYTNILSSGTENNWTNTGTGHQFTGPIGMLQLGMQPGK